MIDLDVKQIRKTIEEYLYLYQCIDMEILDIKNKFKDEKEMKKEIKKLKKIKKIVEEMLKYYQINDINNYTYIILKYFKKLSPKDIEAEMFINGSVQWRIKNDIIYTFTVFALKEKII